MTQGTSDATRASVTSVRARQMFLVTAGVVHALAWPVAMIFEAFGTLVVLLSSATMLLVPLAWVLFTRAVEKATESLAGPPPERAFRVWVLALFTAAPIVGSFVEVIVLHRLAKLTAGIDGAVDRTRLVTGLAVARFFSVWLVPAFAGVFIGLVDLPMIAAVYSIGPLASFALLSVLTQILITPLLDHLVPERAVVRLGGAGATSSMAVSSTTGASASRRD